MDNMFEELINIRETPTYYEIALVNREQFNNKSARNKVFKLFHEDSIRFMQRDFDSLVEREIIPPCNTKMIATVFMHSVLIGNDMRLYEIMKQEIPIDATQMYIDLKELITSMLKNGV